MYLQSLACAVPPCRHRQADLWPLYRSLPLRERLRPGSNELIHKLLVRDNGVDYRHMALGELEELFALDAEGLNRAFEREAPKLASAALSRALAGAELEASALDGLIVCTCTGYLCPGVSSHVAEEVGLRSDAALEDIVGMGCGAAIPSLRSAAGAVALAPGSRVAVVAVEVCSAAFFLEDRGDVIISACLFGDGAAAAIVGSEAVSAAPWRIGDFDTEHRPEARETLRFLNDGGKLKNRLDRSVPERAGEAVETLWQRYLERGGPPAEILPHAGGREVLAALGARLPGQPFPESAWCLREGGNLSSPSCLFALSAYLHHHDKALPVALPEAWGPPPRREPRHPGSLWLTSFGAGFAAHACRVVREG
jgi:predicted naringenin-chalcone synthase